MRGMTFSDLPETGQWLVREMRRIDFGSIEGLVIRDGLPTLAPKPRVIREVRFGSAVSGRTPEIISDFNLKAEVVALFGAFSTIENGVVRAMEVRHGLPVQLRIEES